MKKDEVVEIALSVGAVIEFGRAKVFYTHKELQDFANEVERRTLERAAVVCDERIGYGSLPIPCPDGIAGCMVAHYAQGLRLKTGDECATAIRALKENT